MTTTTLIQGLIGLSLLYFLLSRLLSRSRSSAPLPPGPKGKPIVGNLADLPPPGVQEWRHWLQFKERYGIAFFHSPHNCGCFCSPLFAFYLAIDQYLNLSYARNSRFTIPFETNLPLE